MITACRPVENEIYIGKRDRPSPASTLSRNSFPALKWGTDFAGTATCSPVFGFRPVRGARWFRLKTPKPRISTRLPSVSVSEMAVTISFTATSASLVVSCGNRRASSATSSERFTANPLLRSASLSAARSKLQLQPLRYFKRVRRGHFNPLI